ncbi:MAG TPA: MarR family transcriptional regulator [Byssovorax sp.]
MGKRGGSEFVELLGAVTRRVRALMAEAYARHGVGSAQAKLIRHIGKNSRISQADLARATGTAPTLTGRSIEPLVRRGWVRRRRSEGDRRQYVLELAAAGERARAELEAARGEVVARVAAALDAEDLDDFERIGRKLLAALAQGDDV